MHQADMDPNLYATQIGGNVGVPLNVAAIFYGGWRSRYAVL